MEVFESLLRRVATRLNVPPPVRLRPIKRAMLTTGISFDRWFEFELLPEAKREYRRLRSRLGEKGRLTITFRGNDEPLEPWVQEFLALEKSGWKGREGTALACFPSRKRFTCDTLDQLNRRGKLLFWRMALDDKPIAMLFAMIAGNTVFLEKMAYDENYARFSPGVLLILEVTRTLIERSGIARVDLSAIPNHPTHEWSRTPVQPSTSTRSPATSNQPSTVEHWS